jgi:hypothetical protein
LRYLISARRQERAPVACIVIFEESSCDAVSYALAAFDMTYHCPFRLDTFSSDVHLQRICLGVLRVPKIQNLIQQLIDQYEVVLYSLLVEFAEVSLSQSNQTIQKFKDQRRIGIALCYGDQIDVLVFDMAKGGGAKGENGRAHLRVGDDLYTEDIGKSRAAVVTEGAKDEVLTLLIEDEDSREHGGDVGGDSGRRQGIGCVGVLMLGAPPSTPRD